MRKIREFSGRAAAVVGAVTLVVAMSGTPAAAAIRSGGYKSCGSGYHVVTWAQTGSGDVAHHQRVGNDIHSRYWFDRGYGNWTSYAGWPTRRSIDGWSIESHYFVKEPYATCASNPI